MIKDDLTYKIIGCAMNVHNELGNGFQEVIYQRCLALELAQAGINTGGKQLSEFFTRELKSAQEGLTLLLKKMSL